MQIFRRHNRIAVPNPECGLCFSARDLVMRLVRENLAIPGKIKILSEPLVGASWRLP
jgi:hypothetical protein